MSLSGGHLDYKETGISPSSPQATNSVSVTAGDMVWVACGMLAGDATSPSGLGVSWSLADVAVITDGFDWRLRLYYGTVPSSTSGTISFTISGFQMQFATGYVRGTGGTLSVVGGSIVKDTGTSAAGCIPVSPTRASASNVRVGALFSGQSTADCTLSSGWTEQSDVLCSGGNNRLTTGFNGTNDVNLSATTGLDPAHWTGIVFEVTESSAAGSFLPWHSPMAHMLVR